MKHRVSGNKTVTFYSEHVYAEKPLRVRVDKVIKNLIKQGVKNFIFVNNDTITRYAITSCLKLQTKYHLDLNLKLSNISKIEEYERYYNFKVSFNYDKYESEKSLKQSIKNCDILVCYIYKDKEKDNKILNFANKHNIEVVNIFDKTDYDYQDEEKFIYIMGKSSGAINLM